MRVDLVKPFYSSFLSCEKDFETILKKLFIENPKRAEELKRLLVINTKDCLDNKESEVYKETIKKATLPMLINEGYVKINPRIDFSEHEELKSYIIISFDNFMPNAKNPEFRDCSVIIDIVCPTKQWELGNYRLRPLKIAGYIDGLLNKSKLSGIGVLNFMSCEELVLDPELGGYTLLYRAIHGVDDIIPDGEY